MSDRNCPHCGKSNWKGTDPEGCCCVVPAESIHSHTFYGDVSVLVPAKRPGHLVEHRAAKAEVTTKISLRRDLYHFIRSMEFHLKAAQDHLAKMDEQMKAEREDPTCRRCGFVECACLGR